jgi:cytochrome b subunit of formate dehydrogenase/mono/diheme cytochrome c family protein
MSNPPVKTYVRFSLTQRIEHWVFMAAFSVLGLTGLAQKFASQPAGGFVLSLLGGIETARIIHHSAAFVMMLSTIFHIGVVLYKVYVLRVPWSMLPTIGDFIHLIQDVLYYLGFRKHHAYYGRYNYAEKMEYLAVIWGTVIMGLTGFIMWNPITTTKILTGAVIPASKAAHGGEAILAVLAIIIWHFYHVHLKHLNKSIFTGRLTHAEMAREHPAELEMIEEGQASPTIPAKVLRQRQVVYAPVMFVLTAAMTFGVYKFITAENTASFKYVPPEHAAAFAPVTPTPTAAPTQAPQATPVPGLGNVQVNSWEGSFGQLFRNRCSTCHGVTSVGGLTLATYQDALKGGGRGPAIVPNDPDGSMLVQIQSVGSHPGQLSAEELALVIAWIKSGAPER